MKSFFKKSFDFKKSFEKKKDRLGSIAIKETVPCAYGYTHRSKLEASVCQIIWLREKAGEIVHRKHEVHLYLTLARIGYIADFECADAKTDMPIFIESKGFESDRWPIIKKLWAHYGFGNLEVWKGTYRRPHLVEVITPKGRGDI